MEKHSGFNKIAIITKDDSILVNANDESNKNVEVFIEKRSDQGHLSYKNLDLFDVTLLDNTLPTFDTIVFVENLLHPIIQHEDFQRRLFDLNNVINICTEHHLRLIYVGGFTSNYGQHLNIHVDEKTIWESSIDVSLHDKYIHLAIQDLYRAIQEGLSTTIVSCGLPFDIDDLASIKHYILSNKPLAEYYHFIAKSDIIDTVKTLINHEDSSSSPERLLLVNQTVLKTEILQWLNIKEPWYKKLWFNTDKPSSSKSSLNISTKKTLDYLNKSFKAINIFDHH